MKKKTIIVSSVAAFAVMGLVGGALTAGVSADGGSLDVQLNKENFRESITRNVEKLDNGVRITETSEDAETVSRLHDKADKFAMKDKISKEVIELDNGVKVTVSGSDAESIEFIQSRDEKRKDAPEGVNVTRENTDTGVVMTITSDDAEHVEKIQERAEKGPGHGKKGMKGGRRGGGEKAGK